MRMAFLACSPSFSGRFGGGYVHIQVVCGLVACVVWERRWGQSLRTMTVSILPDAEPKRLRSQTGLLRLWGQVGVIEIMTYLCKELKCIILSPINFRSAKSNSMRQVAKGSKQEKSG